MAYETYTNRYGRQMILIEPLKSKFLQMKDALHLMNIDIEMTEGFRGQTQQNEDYDKGVSKARWGQSAHNFAAAFDCAPIIDGTLSWPDNDTLWNTIGEMGKANDLVWGGDFHSILDKPHFELRDWKSLNLYSEENNV